MRSATNRSPRTTRVNVSYVVTRSRWPMRYCLVGLILLFLLVHGERPRGCLHRSAVDCRRGRIRAAADSRDGGCRRRRPAHDSDRRALSPYGREEPDAIAAAVAPRCMAVRAGRDRRRRCPRRDSACVPAASLRAAVWAAAPSVSCCTSVAFGAGHLLQGADAATGDGPARRVLGRRLSAAPLVCRADGQPRQDSISSRFFSSSSCAAGWSGSASRPSTD